MTDEEFSDAVKGLMLRVREAEADAAEQVARKARADAEAAEHTRDYVRDYYRLPATPAPKGGAS